MVPEFGALHPVSGIHRGLALGGAVKLQHADSPEGPWLDVPAGQAPTRRYVRRLDESVEEQADRRTHELLERRRAERRAADSTWRGPERRQADRRSGTVGRINDVESLDS